MSTSSTHPDGSSVVSIWGYNDESKQQKEFIGSAFFISPSLVLTAKHVVKDKLFLFDNLLLGLVDGQHEVKLNLSNIYCHPALDIALILLSVPYSSQSLCTLSLQRKDYLKEKVNCYGIHKDNHNRDANLGYTVGTYDSIYSGYLIDHQVKKGFSGGPVIRGDTHEVIGIFSQRDTTNQETLFIPLSLPKCKEWLEEINTKKIKDPKLNEYLFPEKYGNRKAVDFSTFAKNLEYLSIFIDRPASAYEHITKELVNSDTTIKLCLCLYSSDQDAPAEFTKALAFKLNAKQTDKSGQDLLKNVQEDKYDMDRLSGKVWASSHYDQFYQSCLSEMIDKLSNNSFANNPRESTSEALEERFIELFLNRSQPIVFMQRDSIKSTHPLLYFFKENPKKLLKQRFEWINRFNKDWKKVAKNKNMQSIALLFFVHVDYAVSKNPKKCFSLEQIERNNYYTWLEFVSRFFTQHQYGKEQLNNFWIDYEAKLFTSHENNKLTFPSKYHHFRERVKTISHYEQ